MTRNLVLLPDEREITAQNRSLDQFNTPAWVAEALVEEHFGDLGACDLVLEPTAGRGHFLAAIPAGVPAIGVEIDPAVAAEARRLTGRRVLVGDIRTVALDCAPTVLLGNLPFKAAIIDAVLRRAFELLPQGGRCGFILPAYALQTASRVVRIGERWSIRYEMIPKHIYPRLRHPLLFARFFKDGHRTLVGFSLYREFAEVQRLRAPYRALLDRAPGGVWGRVVATALAGLGGEATLPVIYAEIEGRRPTPNQWWREKVRQVLQAPPFRRVAPGRYALPTQNAA